MLVYAILSAAAVVLLRTALFSGFPLLSDRNGLIVMIQSPFQEL